MTTQNLDCDLKSSFPFQLQIQNGKKVLADYSYYFWFNYLNYSISSNCVIIASAAKPRRYVARCATTDTHTNTTDYRCR